MKLSLLNRATFLASVLLLAVAFAPAQDTTARHAIELKAEVPALKTFHTVIYEIWHGAWPQKDTAKLAALLPKVEEGVTSIAAAKLPGILRDKKPAWDNAVQELKAVTAEYRSAVEKKESQPLLDAAEKLHMQFEKLVRVTRPVMKEVEEFHTVLYMLYHYYMPGDLLNEMKSSASALKEKMALLNKAVLPERLKSREPSFAAAREKLSASVDALASAAGSDSVQNIKSAVTAVHTNYQTLEKVFE